MNSYSRTYTQKLSQFIEDMVYNGAQSYYDLDTDEKAKITALYIFQDLRNRADFLYKQNDYESTISFLLSFMLDEDKEKIEIMSEMMSFQAVKHFEKEIAEYFKIEFDYLDESKKYDAGFKKYESTIGESYWAK